MSPPILKWLCGRGKDSTFGRADRTCRASAFTLVEIMIVVALLGIVAAMGIPSIVQFNKKEDLRKAVADVVEVCSNARAQAILRGTTVELVIHPQERSLAVSAVPASKSTETDGGEAPPAAEPATPRSGLSAQISDRITIEMVDVNLFEYKDLEEAKVRFYPNGTCDELTIVLRSEKNEFRKISLEATTSLASVDPIGPR